MRKEVEAQLAVFKRGVVDLIEERELAERIETDGGRAVGPVAAQASP
jgi:hypothetical protein